MGILICLNPVNWPAFLQPVIAILPEFIRCALGQAPFRCGRAQPGRLSLFAAPWRSYYSYCVTHPVVCVSAEIVRSMGSEAVP